MKKEPVMPAEPKTKAEPAEPSGELSGESEEQKKDGGAKIRKNYGKILAIVLGIMIIIGLGYGYTVIIPEKRIQKFCHDIESSPDLTNQAVCVPFRDEESALKDYAESRTEPVCRCTVTLADGNKTIIDVRKSK